MNLNAVADQRVRHLEHDRGDGSVVEEIHVVIEGLRLVPAVGERRLELLQRGRIAGEGVTDHPCERSHTGPFIEGGVETR